VRLTRSSRDTDKRLVGERESVDFAPRVECEALERALDFGWELGVDDLFFRMKAWAGLPRISEAVGVVPDRRVLVPNRREGGPTPRS
jgi:hypothetical protein